MGAISAAHAHKTVGQYAAFEKGLELVFDKLRQARSDSPTVGTSGRAPTRFESVTARILSLPALMLRCIHYLDPDSNFMAVMR